MFGKKTQKSIESLIGASTTINGDVSFEGGLRIDGTVNGNVNAIEGKSSMLVVSEQAHVEGEIRVSHLVVNGTIVGPVYATELLELQPNSRIKGDVHYHALEMHHGAVVDGHLVHTAALPKPAMASESHEQDE